MTWAVYFKCYKQMHISHTAEFGRRMCSIMTVNVKCAFLRLNLSIPGMFSVELLWLSVSYIHGFYTALKLNKSSFQWYD